MYSPTLENVRERALYQQRRAVRNAMFFGANPVNMTDDEANRQADKVIRAVSDGAYILQAANKADEALTRRMLQLQRLLDHNEEG